MNRETSIEGVNPTPEHIYVASGAIAVFAFESGKKTRL